MRFKKFILKEFLAQNIEDKEKAYNEILSFMKNQDCDIAHFLDFVKLNKVFFSEYIMARYTHGNKWVVYKNGYFEVGYYE